MLRVRPVLFTSHLAEYSKLLIALGMWRVHDAGDWQVFDSGQGKVGLHGVLPGGQDGTATLGFEIRDAPIFVRRTLADGTHAELVDSRHGPTARVTAPDGFTFLADPVVDAPAATPAAGPLTVVQLWSTPEVAAATKVLADIGTKPVAGRPDAPALFRAKNGGLTAARLGEVSGVDLGFRYDGDLTALAAQLTAAGVPAVMNGDVMEVQNPHGGTLRIVDSLEF
ncbi:VOC family protein [Arthrobacter sp. HLT1-20]